MNHLIWIKHTIITVSQVVMLVLTSSYNINSCYEQSIIFGYLTAVDCFNIMLSTISSETNTPSNQVTLDDWTVILEVESIEGVPYQPAFG